MCSSDLQAAADADVVIDYLWGAPTAAAMTAVVTGRADRGRALTWIEIGSVAGPVASVPSAALRAARLQIVGSGQGSVSTREILAELPGLAQAITSGTFDADARPVPLADVEQAWADAARTSQRIVLVPAALAGTVPGSAWSGQTGRPDLPLSWMSSPTSCRPDRVHATRPGSSSPWSCWPAWA